MLVMIENLVAMEGADDEIFVSFEVPVEPVVQARTRMVWRGKKRPWLFDPSAAPKRELAAKLAVAINEMGYKIPLFKKDEKIKVC